MRVAVGVEYDGSAFHGWEKQKGDLPTVQGAVEKALSQVANGAPVPVVCAGRTDTGVHALCQVIHFDAPVSRPLKAWLLGGNTYLPPSVRFLWTQEMPEEFHARYSAVARSYQYTILNRAVAPGLFGGNVSWCYRPLDVSLMQQAANFLLGTHDFNAYRTRACQAHSSVRTLHSLAVSRDRDLVIIKVKANAFLQHMVRNLAGVLMAIGKGECPPEWAKEVLDSRDRTQGGVTAPPQGLTFMQVDYAEEFVLPTPVFSFFS
jgi:tRNA pseudouridine38-40 synthase